MAVGELSFRDGSAADLASTFAISEHAMHQSATRQGVIPADHELTDAEIRGDWLRRRPMLEFMAAQAGGRYVICEDSEGLALGYARVVRFDGMEELTELMVAPEHQGNGIGRRLLDLAWPGDPTPELGRVVVATGSPSDLSLYIGAGVMPVSGHWQLRQRTSTYLARRSQETDTADPGVHVLEPERAVAEWKRLEPPAVGHERPSLHDFFGRDRTCLALMGESGEQADALCWVSSEAEIGPAVAATPGQLVPVVLAALDRVAMTQQPGHLNVFATTISWWLLRRLRTLGFSVFWPGWILCSNPLPGLDRYVPTRPPHVL